MALAFGCMLLAIAILGIIGIVPVAFRSGPRHALPTVEMLPVYLLFAFPGWVLALPIVLFFKDADGWRAWATLAIGTAIGPCFLLTWTLVASGGRITWQAEGAGMFMSLFIGFLTAALYVLALKRFKRKPLATSSPTT